MPKKGEIIPLEKAFFMRLWLATERCKLFVKNFECNKPEFIKYKEREELKKKKNRKQMARLRFGK